MPKLICIHGHFYQPPRENAWLERIERQDSAHPFHDWNARIESECYGPNARARILDREDLVTAMDNNYARISFNFGPTLLSWLEQSAPRTYTSILEADRQSTAAFGRGSAMAQAYNHVIMPLASERDKRTQVRWGVADFEHRFGRKPEGMWLPETAVCLDSLRALVDAGITFTVLSPRQARSVRKKGATTLAPVSEATLDTRVPYKVDLGQGRSIAVFFYDGATSQAVAFERLLSNGEGFAHRLAAGFATPETRAELVHIATDGETYGHHHRFGEMALAYALRSLAAQGVQLTNYASFLAAHPPEDEATIHERTAWSCAHGVGRWSADCGCRMRGDSSQAWRGPLRDALNFVAQEVDSIFERYGEALFTDPWKARDDYVHVILDRSRGSVERFFDRQRTKPLSWEQEATALELCEMQRHRQLMYTSCGWFFDDVDGIETTQILQYACRAMELARKVSGEDLEPELIRRIESAHASNAKAINGRKVYEHSVLPARSDAARLATTFGIGALFGVTLSDTPAFELFDQEVRIERRDEMRFAAGKIGVRSTITGREERYTFAVLHQGGPVVRGGLRRIEEEEEVRSAADWLSLFDEEPTDALLARIANELPIEAASLKTIPLDERGLVVERILADAVRVAERAYRQVFTENAALLTELAGTGVRPPRALTAATRVVLESDLLRAARRDPPDARAIRNLLLEARAENVHFDEQTFEFELQLAVDRTCAELEKDPADDSALGRLGDLLAVAVKLRPNFDLSRPQDLAWPILQEASHPLAKIARERGRLGAWRDLAKRLRLRLD